MIITQPQPSYESPYNVTGHPPVYDDVFVFEDEEDTVWEEIDEGFELPTPNTPPACA